MPKIGKKLLPKIEVFYRPELNKGGTTSKLILTIYNDTNR